MSAPIVATPYEPILSVLQIATKWAASEEAVRADLALALSELTQRADWKLSICRTPQEVLGVSVVLADGGWYVDALNDTAALMLANMAVVNHRIPRRLVTSEPVASWMRPHLHNTGHVQREGHGTAMLLRRPKTQGQGTWAGPADLQALHAFGEGMTRGDSAYSPPSWAVLAAFHRLAVAYVDGAIVATVQRFGVSESFAGISGAQTLPRFRGSEIEKSLLGFAAHDLLRERPAVYSFVGDQAAEIELLRSVGFEPTGSRSISYFQ